MVKFLNLTSHLYPVLALGKSTDVPPLLRQLSGERQFYFLQIKYLH